MLNWVTRTSLLPDDFYFNTTVARNIRRLRALGLIRDIALPKSLAGRPVCLEYCIPQSCESCSLQRID